MPTLSLNSLPLQWRSLSGLLPVPWELLQHSPLVSTVSNTSSLAATSVEISKPISWRLAARDSVARWGESINIYDDPRLGRPDATATEIQVAKDTLLQILVLFADTEGISKKYKIAAKDGEDLSVFSMSDMDPTLIALDNKMKSPAIRHILEQTVSLIDNIEKLFPAPEAQMTLVRQEVAEVGDKQSVELIENIAKGVDSLLQGAVRELRTGHLYMNIVVRGQAQTGDAYRSDWRESAKGASHQYDSIEVEKGGKALIGNNYGGKDFWDN